MSAGDRPGRVVVVGSLNRDYVCTVDRLPVPGQTVLGGELLVGSGGKGGNQAVAAARCGARTAMVGCVGEDDDGRALVGDLAAAGVDTSAVVAVPGVRTGAAVVLVGGDGENAIVVAPGANARLAADDAAAALDRALVPGAVVVAQAEIPAGTVHAVLRAAAAGGCRPVLNLAPYRAVPDDVLALCDPLVVNETEAAQLLGRELHGAESAAEAARELRPRARSVVVTVGAAGAVAADAAGVTLVPAPRVAVVDTTGAGDAFTGALAAALGRGSGLVAAVRLGVRAASWSVRRPGAQASYPTASQLGVDPAPPTP